MESAARILVVEDEASIRDGLDALFATQGMQSQSVGSGDAALRVLADARFDLIVLDLMLPGITGLEVLRQLRKKGDPTPVLVLTARGAEDDVVAGLEAGADDYVTKPFGVRELVARVRGLLRRPVRDEGSAPPPRIFSVGDVTLDLESLELRWAGGTLRITSREADLLGYLSTHSSRAVPREELLVEVWGYRDGTIRTRTVDVHVQQLRAKLSAVPGGARWIGTVRGRGYRFEAALSRPSA